MVDSEVGRAGYSISQPYVSTEVRTSPTGFAVNLGVFFFSVSLSILRTWHDTCASIQTVGGSWDVVHHV